MKKFIMVSPYQRAGGLKKSIYTAVDNQRLKYDKPTGFPLISLINGYVEKGEKIEIIVVVADYDNSKQNYELFRAEIAELSAEKEFEYKITEVNIPYNDYINTQLELFGKLIEHTSDSDTLYACITYGSKPVPIVQIMALNYAYRIRKNVNIGCIVYGKIDHNPPEKSEIYDITSLIFIDETVRLMAENKIEDPLPFIKKLLK